MSISQVQNIVKKDLVQVALTNENGIGKKVFQVQKRIVSGGVTR
jgi:hypothetical protein